MLSEEKYLLVGINNKQRIKEIWLIGMTNTSISDLFYFASCATRRNVHVYRKCCALLGKYGTGCGSFRSMKWCRPSVCLHQQFGLALAIKFIVAEWPLTIPLSNSHVDRPWWVLPIVTFVCDLDLEGSKFQGQIYFWG